MANESSEKYKLFRNYMANELGVTRADIERWTKESVAVETNKKLDQLNVPAMVKDSIASIVQRTFQSGYNHGSNELKSEIAKQIANRFYVISKDTPPVDPS